MSKAILMSINPRWCELIARGEKTIEIRKTIPKDLTPPFKVYIYMTAGDASYTVTLNGAPYTCHNNGGKTVIGEFVCRNIDDYSYDYCPHPEIGMDYDCGDNWWEIGDDELDRACMTEAEFRQYARPRTTMFGWHISDLVIYERTKSLREFHRPCDSKCDGLCFEGVNCCRTLTRPPQSWCYVAEEAHHD